MTHALLTALLTAVLPAAAQDDALSVRISHSQCETKVTLAQMRYAVAVGTFAVGASDAPVSGSANSSCTSLSGGRSWSDST